MQLIFAVQMHGTGRALSGLRVVRRQPDTMLQRKLCRVPSVEKMTMPIFFAHPPICLDWRHRTGSGADWFSY